MMSTHPVQQAALVALTAFNLIGLVCVNEYKKRQPVMKEVPWERKKMYYLACIAITCCFNCYLDAHYYLDTKIFLILKTFMSAFPITLLDLYVSKTRGVEIPSVLMGASIHCTLNIANQYLCDWALGEHTPIEVLQTPMALSRLPYEYARVLCAFVFAGMLADLTFSPIHRYFHSTPELYKKYHKKHHEYTRDITCLIAYYADAFDDLLMSVSLALTGALLYRLAAHALFPGWEPFSNLTLTFVILGGNLGHAHDGRCGRLLLPGLPESWSPVTYHQSHHVHPNRNFGLTIFMDRFWDRILGVDTIKNYYD